MKSKLSAILLAFFSVAACGADIASVNFKAIKEDLREYYFSKPENAEIKERFKAAVETEKKFQDDMQEKLRNGDKSVDIRSTLPPRGAVDRFELERKIDSDLKNELYRIVSDLGLKYELIYDASDSGTIIYAKSQVEDITTTVKQAILDRAATAPDAPAPADPTAESPAPNSPAAPATLPGLIARCYLGGDHPPLLFPTPLVAVMKTGSEFPDVLRPLMENELRGTMDVGRLEYAASGFIVLDRDMEVRFDIKNMVCKVDGKDFGDGNYTQALEKGQHRVELIRRGWASGKPSFAITDPATKKPVVFHSSEALNREVDHSVKVGGKDTKSKLIGPVTE